MKTNIKCYSQCILYILFSPVRWLLEAALKIFNLVILYRIFDGIGDTIAMTTILSGLNKRLGCKGIILSRTPAIFENNDQVVAFIDYGKLSKLTRSLLKFIFRHSRGSRIFSVGPEIWTPGSYPWAPQPHGVFQEKFYEGLQPDARYRVDTSSVRPVLAFSEQELERFAKKYSHLPEHYCIVKATGGTCAYNWARLKEWSPDRFQSVISSLNHLNWVQIGQEGEPALDGVINLLGQASLREVFYLLSRAQAVLTVEGMISHAMAAFDAPAIVVFSGAHDPRGLLYHNTHPVVAATLPPCTPCWGKGCSVPGKPCTGAITAQQVVTAIEQAMKGKTQEGIIQFPAQP